MSAPRVMQRKRGKEKAAFIFVSSSYLLLLLLMSSSSLAPFQRESTHPSLTTTLDFQKTKKCGERERDKKEKTQNLKQTHQHLDLRDVNRAHRYISVSVSLLCVFSIWVKTLSVSLYLLSPPSLSLLLLWIFFFPLPALVSSQ